MTDSKSNSCYQCSSPFGSDPLARRGKDDPFARRQAAKDLYSPFPPKHGDVRRAGFGTVEEFVPLMKGQSYGRAGD